MIRYVIVALFSLLVVCAAQLHAAEWKVGVGRTNITPTEPTWLSGYASRNHPAEGVAQELFAKALAFESNSGVRLVLVTCDLGSIYMDLTSAVREAAFQQFGLPREAIVINVSHTHCAPEIAAERKVISNYLSDTESDKLDQYIREELQPKLIQLVGHALADMKPAKLRLSPSTAAFASNRRLPTKNGFINRQNPEGVVDHQVPVLQVTTPEGKLRAVLFGYACHNTTLRFYQYCGDYAGFAQENIERTHPGATALFMMGCGGDQNPYPRHGPRGLEYCQRHGMALAGAVEKALQGRQTEVHGPLRLASETVQLKLEPLPSREQLEKDAAGAAGVAKRKANYLLTRLRKHGKIEQEQPCPLFAARFGDELLLLGFSGETVVDYSIKSKVEFAGPFVWVAGYCNDVFAYLPSRRVLKEGGYEGRESIVHQLTPTPFAESVEDNVMGGMRRLVRKVKDSNN